MSGLSDLHQILSTLDAKLNDGLYGYTTTTMLEKVPLAEANCIFREEEGWTMILPVEVLQQRELPFEYACKWITLQVHSSLSSVGLTAAISSALAAENISCNIIAGYYHDHLFVAPEKAEKTLEILKKLSSTAGK